LTRRGYFLRILRQAADERGDAARVGLRRGKRLLHRAGEVVDGRLERGAAGGGRFRLQLVDEGGHLGLGGRRVQREAAERVRRLCQRRLDLVTGGRDARRRARRVRRRRRGRSVAGAAAACGQDHERGESGDDNEATHREPVHAT